MLKKLSIWMRAVRAPFFSATLCSGITGTACAWNHTGFFDPPIFMLTLFGIIFLNTGVNLINDYFDHTSGLDEINETPTRFSGGSRVIQEGLIEPGKILTAGILSFIFAAVIGLFLNWKAEGNTILIIGLVGIFLGYFYSAPPLRLGYTPLAETIAGFCCGPLIILGSYYVQTQMLNIEILLVSLPVGLLVFLILLINEFPDYFADQRVNKRTLVIVAGKEKSSIIYKFLLYSVYLMTFAGIIIGIFPVFAVIFLATYFITLKAVRIVRDNQKIVLKMLPANAATIILHFLFCFSIILAFIMDGYIRGV